jgi:hypothetical protein
LGGRRTMPKASRLSPVNEHRIFAGVDP